MKKFSIYILGILFSLILLLYLADFIFTTVYIKSIPRNKLQYILKEKNKFYDIVFLGSSRVANHVDTELFSKLSGKRCINLGVEGAGLNDNLLQLKLLLDSNKVNNLFLQVDNNFQNSSPSNISISEAMPFFTNKIVSDHLKEHFNNYYLLKYIPFYRYAVNSPKIGFREMFFSLINKKPRIDPSKGYIPKFHKALTLKYYSFPKNIVRENPALNEIKLICKEYNVNLILFISPYCSKVINSNYLEQLNYKIPNLYDLSKNYKDDYFSNCSHLNDRGAKEFTKSLFLKTVKVIN
jgi:hypothetical protein